MLSLNSFDLSMFNSVCVREKIEKVRQKKKKLDKVRVREIERESDTENIEEGRHKLFCFFIFSLEEYIFLKFV